MCGIAGIVNLNNQRISQAALVEMTNIITHRGPNGEGHWLSKSGNIGFGHRRLSIIDLSSSGAQPMHYLNGRYTITFNGEIYNYIELRDELTQIGFVFKTHTDTEVVLASFHLKREKCLDDFDGMFAFAIHDSVDNTIFCARDRFGEKPFHYTIFNGNLYFASEIKQFWAAGIPKIVNDKKFLDYIESGQLESASDITTTFYQNITRLDAAHFFTLDLNDYSEIKPIKYWDINLDSPKFNGNLEEATDVFYDLFANSIKLRLRSDVPVGSSLSGGLDSSSIVMLIDKFKGQELLQNTFSARFHNFVKDEGKYIKQVVESCNNVQVHYTWPDENYFADVFDKVVYHQDEPFGSASIVAQYAVMQLAKEKGVTVLLDGQGADEQLGGYLYYYRRYLDQLLSSSLKAYNIELDSYRRMHPDYNIDRIPSKRIIRLKLGQMKRNVFSQKPIGEDLLLKSLYHDTNICGLKELLRYADRNSMAHSTEVRLPFLSHKLVEFIFTLPDNFKLNLGWTKYILRSAMSNTLPDSICWRTDKIGYEPPQSSWLLDKRWQDEIQKSSDFFGIQRQITTFGGDNFNQDWRLLISSKYYL